MSSYKINLKKFLTPQYISLAVLLFVVTAILVYIFGVLNLPKESVISEDQIMIQRGDNTVIVNKNGLIEYRSGDEVIYRNWEASRINSFFADMEIRARNYLETNGGSATSCLVYTVTLYVDGKLVTICMDKGEVEEIDEIFEDEDGSGGGSLSDYFDNDGDGIDDEGGGSAGGSSVSPTPTITYGSTPTPTPVSGGGGGGGIYIPPQSVCEQWASDIVDRAVISNILCTKEDVE